MSTELARHASGIYLARFFGGNDRGMCLQIMGSSDEHDTQWITLTRDEAIWLCGKIITKFLGDEPPDEEE